MNWIEHLIRYKKNTQGEYFNLPNSCRGETSATEFIREASNDTHAVCVYAVSGPKPISPVGRNTSTRFT